MGTVMMIGHFWQITPEKSLLRAKEPWVSQELWCNVTTMNCPQFTLRGIADRGICDNLPELFFDSKNNYKIFRTSFGTQ